MSCPDLAAPPRRVSPRLARRLALASAWSRVGLGGTAFGMLFFWAFAWRSELVTRLEFRGLVREVPGVVTAVSRTNASESDEPVLRVDYAFQLAPSSGREGASYAVGTPLGIGDPVVIEVLDGTERSRIRGMRRRHFGEGVGVFAIALLVAGLGAFAAGVWRGRRRTRLLGHGALGHAKLVSKRATNATVGDDDARPVMALQFRFEVPRDAKLAGYRTAPRDATTTHEFEVRTHEPEKLVDDAVEPVLYDPAHPTRALLLDTLPDLVITPEGHLDAPGATHVELAVIAFLLVANALALALVLVAA